MIIPKNPSSKHSVQTCLYHSTNIGTSESVLLYSMGHDTHTVTHSHSGKKKVQTYTPPLNRHIFFLKNSIFFFAISDNLMSPDPYVPNFGFLHLDLTQTTLRQASPLYVEDSILKCHLHIHPQI